MVTTSIFHGDHDSAEYFLGESFFHCVNIAKSTKMRNDDDHDPNTHHLLFSPPLHSQTWNTYVNISIFHGDHKYATNIEKE